MLKERNYVAIPKAALAVVLIALVFVVGSNITGYTTSFLTLKDQLANATTVSDLQAAKAALGECSGRLNYTSQSFADCRSDLSRMTGERDELAGKNLECRLNLTAQAAELSRQAREIDRWKGIYRTAANDICCIRKAATKDPSIRYFYLSGDNTIVCAATDENPGTVELFCP